MESERQTARIELPRLPIRVIEIPIIGESELITHAWSDKAKKEMLDKQLGKARLKKAPKNPWNDFTESLYWLSPKPDPVTEKDIAEGRFGFPTIGFKAAAVGAIRQVQGMKMTEARIAFHVLGEFAEIMGTPRMREDMVRLQTGVADIRYRAGFPEWSTTLRAQYHESGISLEQLLNLFQLAGFGPGVGDWRPERDGGFGRFRLEGAALIGEEEVAD